MQKFTWLSENQSRQMIEYRRNNPQVFQINKDHIICKKCGKSGHANAKNRLCPYSKKYEPPATETRAGNNQGQVRPTQAPTNGPKSTFHRVIPSHSQPSGHQSALHNVQPSHPPGPPPTGHKSAFRRVIPTHSSQPTDHKSAFRRVTPTQSHSTYTTYYKGAFHTVSLSSPR